MALYELNSILALQQINMYNEEFFKRHLLTIKRKLNSRNMSLIIGAGLSKSVSDLFPSWKELLYDMARALYEPELKIEYDLKKTRKSKTSSHYEDYLRVRLVPKINAIGYLQLVSEFIKLNGYREIVETYIDDRIPRVVQKGNHTYLLATENGKEREIPLPTNALDIHKQLLELPWNNIYTTNYDTLIEHCIDDQIPKNLKNRIGALNEEIDRQKNILNDYPAKILAKENELARFDEAVQQESSANTNATFVEKKAIGDDDDDEYKVSYPNSERQDIVNELARLRVEHQSAEKIINDNYEQIERLQGLINECLNVVYESRQLGVKRNRNLIKLHGTLRKETYGFDNDIHNHYIISAEDYAAYPTKHEAFTQLMRISLLQESFCLLGFSGVDPNFLAWISWVRDILYRGEKSAHKIYLIEATDQEATKDKALYFENHSILHLPILNKNCISFLEKNLDRKINDHTSRRDVIMAVAEFLSDGKNIDKPRIALELLAIEDYKQAWSDTKVHSPRDTSLVEIIKSGAKIKPLKEALPDVNFAYSHNKKSLLYFASHYCTQARTIEEKNNLARLLIIALNDQLVSYKFFDDDEAISKLFNEIDNPDLIQRFQFLKLKDAVWRSKAKEFETEFKKIKIDSTEISDEATYLRVFSSMVNFDFEKAFNLLKKWSPTEQWKTRKAGLLVYFDHEASVALLKSAKLTEFHLRLYNYEMLSYFVRAKTFASKDSSYELVKLLEAEGLRTVSKATDYLVTQFKKVTVDIKPYGKDRFSIGHGFHASNISPDIQSLQYFGLLFESGFPLVVPNMSFDTPKDTYPLLKSSLRFYPEFILFYVIQYSDTDFVKKVAQDYAHSDAIIEDLPNLSRNIQKAYLSKFTPKEWRAMLLVFYSELLVALPTSEWEDFFLKIWQDSKDKKRLFVELRYSSNEFIQLGLRLISKTNVIAAVATDCLENYTRENGDTAITYLYELAHNKNLKQKATTIGNRVAKQIDLLIEGLNEQSSTSIFLLGNLEVILNSRHRKTLIAKLSAFNFRKISNARIWHVIFFFVKDNPNIVSKLKDGILNSKKLWNTGIKEDGSARFPYEYISLSKLRPNETRSGLIWSDKEKEEITNKLKLQLKKLMAFYKKRSDLSGHETLLEEMQHFVQDELPVNQTNTKLLKDINNIFIEQRGFDSINLGLSSNDRSQVIIALGEVSKAIYQERNLLAVKKSLTLIISKVLLKSEPALEACLFYLSSWLKQFSGDNVFYEMKEEFESIVESYNRNFPDGVDKPFVMAQIYRIAKVLTGWGIKGSDITSIIESEKRYNYTSLLRED